MPPRRARGAVLSVAGRRAWRQQDQRVAHGRRDIGDAAAVAAVRWTPSAGFQPSSAGRAPLRDDAPRLLLQCLRREDERRRGDLLQGRDRKPRDKPGDQSRRQDPRDHAGLVAGKGLGVARVMGGVMGRVGMRETREVNEADP